MTELGGRQARNLSKVGADVARPMKSSLRAKKVGNEVSISSDLGVEKKLETRRVNGDN